MGLFNKKSKFKDLTGQENPSVIAEEQQVQQQQVQQQSIPLVPGSLKEPDNECKKLLMQLVEHNEEIAKNITETNQYILGKLESL